MDVACVVVGGGRAMERAHTTSGAMEGAELLLPQKQHLAHTLMMVHPELNSTIQRHVQ